MASQNSLIGIEQAGIASLLKYNLFRVPPNQRDYAWTELEVGQLFTDIARGISADSDYFLGTIVSIPRQSGIVEVVDGQQRLATSAILLSAIRLYLKEIDENVIEEAILNDFLTGIDRVRRTRIPRLTLNTSDHEVFRKIVTQDDVAELPDATLRSQQLLLEAYEQAHAYVRRIIGAHNPEDHGDQLNLWVTFLESRVRVVHLRVSNDADAYRMFETLNDRGLRTSQADLIKNYLFGQAQERISEVQNLWAYMRGTLESVDDNDITVTFLRHALIAKRGYLRESELYTSVHNAVRSDGAAVAFVRDLEQLATAYAASFNPEHETWNGCSNNVRRAIQVLNTLNIRPLRPLVLAIAARSFEPSEIANVLQFLISLGVRLLIASSTRSSSVELPLARAAHSIWERNITNVEDLKSALSDITPGNEQFRTAFETARVANGRLARYYLRSLETAAANNPEPWFIPIDDPTIVNLEHILPKRPGENWSQFSQDEARFYVNRLGNQALVLASENSALQSDPFEAKKSMYAGSPLQTD